MAYQVLARKYRPQRFADVIGQEHVTRTLLNALSQNRIAHGYIFSGHRGIGKTTIARILASALNCRTAVGTPERPTPEPCLTCASCTEIRASGSVDVIEIDAATNRGIDEIRELRDAARYAPARDKYKIYILDEAHQITDAAFNALLKTLEEPPGHVVFMMATTEPEDIPQTIRSRCQHFSFHAVKFDDIVTQLRTVLTAEETTNPPGVGFDEESLALLAEAGDGSMRDALSITDQALASATLIEGRPVLEPAAIRELMGSVPNAVFERLLEAISENQAAPVIEETHQLLDSGKSPSQLARQFVRYLRNALVSKISGPQSELLQISPDERERVARSAMLFSEEDLTRFLQVILRTFDELNYRQEPRLHLELGLIKLVHLQRLLPVEQLLSQLTGGSSGAPATTTPRASSPGASSRASAAPLSRPIAPATPAPASRPAPAPSVAPPLPETKTNSAPAPFSPFEQDKQRKTSSMGITPGNPSQAPTTPNSYSGTSITSPFASAPAPAAPAMATWQPEQASAVAVAEPPSEPHIPQHQESSSEEPERPTAGEENAEIEQSIAAAISALPGLPALEAFPSLSPFSAETEGTQPVRTPFQEPASPAPSETEPAPLTFSTEPAPTPQAEHPAATLETPASTPPSAPQQESFTAPATSTSELDNLRETICAALEREGHNTAAALLDNGTWTTEGETIQVEVAAKKTMLGLTLNAEADKIIRQAAGAKAKALQFVPGSGTSSAPARASAPPRAGSVQALAMENPLIKQAQELFKAEVRSVLDLRAK